MRDHLRFTQDLMRLRWNQPALRSDNVSVFHADNQNRVIAFHRWLEGIGKDVIVVATLAESTWYNYAIGFPSSGPWLEVLIATSMTTGLIPWSRVMGRDFSIGRSPARLRASANIVIPANGVVIFARDTGD